MVDTWSSPPVSVLFQRLHAQPQTSCRDKRLCKHTPVYHRRQPMHHQPRSPLSELMNCKLVALALFLFCFFPWNKPANDSEQKYCRWRPPPRLCPHDCSGVFMQMGKNSRGGVIFSSLPHFLKKKISFFFSFPQPNSLEWDEISRRSRRLHRPPWQQVRLRFQDSICTIYVQPRMGNNSCAQMSCGHLLSRGSLSAC